MVAMLPASRTSAQLIDAECRAGAYGFAQFLKPRAQLTGRLYRNDLPCLRDENSLLPKFDSLFQWLKESGPQSRDTAQIPQDRNAPPEAKLQQLLSFPC
jgi:hypothetical protein